MAGATSYDFFGEGLAETGVAPGQAADPNDANKWKRENREDPRDYEATPEQIRANRQISLNAPRTPGNIGGVSGAYNTVSDAGRSAFDYYRDIRDPSSVKNYMNAMGEAVGVSRAGDAAIGKVGDTFQIGTPFNALDRVVDPDKGLGIAGQPTSVTGMTPGTRAAAGVLQGATPGSPGALAGAGVGGVRDALDEAMGGAGEIPLDASGADRGGMGSYAGDFDRMRGLADGARGLGSDVMSGAQMPGGQGAQGQTDVMGKALAFKPTRQTGVMKELGGFKPQAQSGVMGELDSFRQAPQGASEAELLLERAAQGNMSDALSIARSGRARDAGSQARALNVAQAQNAATGVDTARDVGALRAKEAEARRAQDLQALSQKGALASGVDQSKLGALTAKGNLAQGADQSALGALNLGGDLASQLRNANVQERGQTLDFTQGQQQIGAGLEGDVLKTIPQLEQIRHDDEFELTPQQKLVQAKLGGGPEKTTADYVTGLLGDVLGVL